MIPHQKQPKLYQKFHEAVVTIDSISWEKGEIKSMIVTYPQERFGGQRILYWNDESKDYSMTIDGENVFEEAREE